MDFKKLIVGFIYYSKAKKSVIVSGTFGEDTQEEARKMSKEYFVNAFNGKKLKIVGNNYEVHAKIKGIEVSSGIADFKNIDFLTDITDVGKIKLNDLMEITD